MMSPVLISIGIVMSKYYNLPFIDILIARNLIFFLSTLFGINA
jgi:hypothetical protein